MTLHPIFERILAPYGAKPTTPVNKALGHLGVTMLTKDLRFKERELGRHMDCADRLTGQIEELESELRDDDTPDYARDLATHRLTRARGELESHVIKSVDLLAGIAQIRAKLELPAHFLTMVTQELKR